MIAADGSEREEDTPKAILRGLGHMDGTRLWLIMRSGDGGERTFPLPGNRTVVGRDRRCDVRIPLPTVADWHCEILCQPDGARVTPLGADGQESFVAVNGTLVEASVDIRDGDELQIGPVTFVLSVRKAADAPFILPQQINLDQARRPDPDDRSASRRVEDSRVSEN